MSNNKNQEQVNVAELVEEDIKEIEMVVKRGEYNWMALFKLRGQIIVNDYGIIRVWNSSIAKLAGIAEEMLSEEIIEIIENKSK